MKIQMMQCIYCQKPFTPSRHWAKYCSKQCREDFFHVKKGTLSQPKQLEKLFKAFK